MNLIAVSWHTGHNVETSQKAEPQQDKPFTDVQRDSMATWWILLSKVYGLMMTTSTIHVQGLPAVGKGLKGTQHVPSRKFVKVLVSHQHKVRLCKFFHCHIIPINAALRFNWLLSNSEVSPRIWTCVIRPSHICGGHGHEAVVWPTTWPSRDYAVKSLMTLGLGQTARNISGFALIHLPNFWQNS